MLKIKLRDAMELYQRRTDRRITYPMIAETTGISLSTLRKIGAKRPYHTTLARIEILCRTLEVTPGDLLELIDDTPKPKTKAPAKKHNKTPPQPKKAKPTAKKPKRTAKKRQKAR